MKNASNYKSTMQREDNSSSYSCQHMQEERSGSYQAITKSLKQAQVWRRSLHLIRTHS